MTALEMAIPALAAACKVPPIVDDEVFEADGVESTTPEIDELAPYALAADSLAPKPVDPEVLDEAAEAVEDALASVLGTKPSPPAAPIDGLAEMQTTLGSKKKRKPKGYENRGPTAMPKNRGSGFEEYYAEPPMTVGEYEEEMGLYDAALPFDERIETCLQRYRARRRLDSERTLLFNRYLSVGGIDCTPRQFNGVCGVTEAPGLTASEKKTLGATDVVRQGGSEVSRFYASDNAALWTVDFAGVAAGFFAVSLRSFGTCKPELVPVGIDVVDNFLRYVQLHDVCPEYAADVQAARAVCAQAKTELPMCLYAPHRMPGQFNRACNTLFLPGLDNRQHHDGIDLRGWDVVVDNADNADVDAATAETVFRATLELHSQVMGATALALAEPGSDLSGVHVVSTTEAELEITALVPPSDELLASYAAKNGVAFGLPKPGTKTLAPAGMVVCKHYCIEEGIANQPRLTPKELAARGKVVFFLDGAAMEMLVTGMKLRVVLHELSCGVTFVSAFKEVMPSFYTFLPQELMLDFKEPKPNERDAPSVNDPYADDKAMDETSKDDF